MSASDAVDSHGLSVAVSGPNGLIGTALRQSLSDAGHDTVGISRTAGPDTVEWDPATGISDPAAIDGIDAVVHLAGENIAAGRWNTSVKHKIADSRITGTRSLVQSLSKLERKPRVLVSASAIGFYGDRKDEPLDEDAAPGAGFLADTCQQWEAEALAAEELGIRVVCIRTGMVLSPAGGALKKMLLPFKLGLGGVVGDGRQYWSYIGLTDLVRAIIFCIENNQLRGPVNAVCPDAPDNRSFTKTLGKILKRPTFLPMPAFAARLALGEMADALLLASARVQPGRLLESEFQFSYPDLETTLVHELNQS
jgi:uncharacterized protein